MIINQTMYIDKVESTNNYLKTLKAKHQPSGLLIYTFNQTSGRGRRGKVWDSKKDEDLAMSIYETSLSNQFDSLMYASIAVVNTLRQYDISATIKLPNDIYVNNKKIAGILIEKIIKKDVISTIIGIGINLNSTRKDNDNEISIKDILQKKINKNIFIRYFTDCYNAIDINDLFMMFKSHISLENHRCLYQEQVYTLKDILSGFHCTLENAKKTFDVPCQHIEFTYIKPPLN